MWIAASPPLLVIRSSRHKPAHCLGRLGRPPDGSSQEARCVVYQCHAKVVPPVCFEDTRIEPLGLARRGGEPKHLSGLVSLKEGLVGIQLRTNLGDDGKGLPGAHVGLCPVSSQRAGAGHQRRRRLFSRASERRSSRSALATTLRRRARRSRSSWPHANTCRER